MSDQTPPVDEMQYERLAHEALRGVMRAALQRVLAEGLPGAHHFYITFKTRAVGVSVPPDILAKYPEEMTVILQHQFWDLTVSEDRFEVGLSFGGIPERLVVPFSSIKSFFDPSAQFGLQFEQAPVERRPRTHANVTPSSAWVRAKVKWFNRARGFGFASEGEGSPDIFIHMETLRKTAIADLQPDSWIYIRFGDGPKGKMAAEVRVSLEGGPAHTQ